MNPLPYATYLQAQRRMVELEAGPYELRPLARAASDHGAPAGGMPTLARALVALFLLSRRGSPPGEQRRGSAGNR